MSKPDKPGELQDVEVQAISMVSKAANGEKFKIFKSVDDEPEPEIEEEKVPEVVKEEKDERGLFRILKDFFTGSDKGDKADKVEKGEVTDIYNKNETGRKMDKAFNALLNVLGLDRWDENSKPEIDSVKIISAIDEFRNLAIEIMLGKSDVEKAGRKISGSNLGKLKNIQSMLADVLSGLDDTENASKETEELTKEEIQKEVAEAVKAANIGNVVKEMLAPIIERIEKIENARGVSNRVIEESAVEKGTNDFWGGLF